MFERFQLVAPPGVALGVLSAFVLMSSTVQPASLTPASAASVPLVSLEGDGRFYADRDHNKLFDSLDARLQATAGQQRLKVIVRYRPGGLPAHPRTGATVLETDNSIAVELTPAEIRRLASAETVESVEPDLPCHVMDDSANLSFGVTSAQHDFGLTGDGDGDPNHFSPRDHNVALIDSFPDPNHRAFAGGRLIASRSFLVLRQPKYDAAGHGTAVGSIIAGVAPGSGLIGLGVVHAYGLAVASDIVRAINWSIAHRAEYGIEVINLSLGNDEPSDGTDALCRAVDRAHDAGIAVFVAAGNSGPEPGTIGSPAAARGAITIGNFADLGKGGFYLHPSSSRGPTLDGRTKPDLCGPGVGILAADANTGGGYRPVTGTSAACPCVAGVGLLMLQANPSLTPDQIKAILVDTAIDWGRPGKDNEFGAGRLDAHRALARVTGKSGTPPEVPPHFVGIDRLDQASATAAWKLHVIDLRFPVALTLLTEEDGADFDILVYDSQGKLVAAAENNARQEVLTFHPEETGDYSIVVRAASGASSYTLDVSAGATDFQH
jgi:serine protease AprX